ncbi:MAG: EAL domain-containing protein, partial [Nitriliruptoraceae bacterium]
QPDELNEGRPIPSADVSQAANLTHSIDDPDRLIATVLRLIRKRFGLDVSFVSQVHDGKRTFRFVDTHDGDAVVRAGESDPVEDSYCGYVLDGSLPQFLPDPAQHPVSAAMPATHGIPVGTHLSVPITFSDGAVYGTLCSFGYDVHDDLDERDIDVLHVLAGMIAGYVEDAEARRQAEAARASKLQSLQVGHDMLLVFQPIVELATRHVVGIEALSRFPTLQSGPASVFDDAWRLGLGLDLELRAAEAALRCLNNLPKDRYLAINLAPATLASDQFLKLAQTCRPQDRERIVVEITEHAVVEDYHELTQANRKLRDFGIRFAVDDVGTGYSGLDHMLRVEPDILKLDGALIAGIDGSPSKQAMVAALQTYAARIGTKMIAERVETPAEHDTLSILGIGHGQGYLYAKPAPFADLKQLAT